MKYLEIRSRNGWVREGRPIMNQGEAETYAESRAFVLRTKTRVVEITEKVVYKSSDHGKQATNQSN